MVRVGDNGRQLFGETVSKFSGNSTGDREAGSLYIGIDPGGSGGIVTLQGDSRGLGVDYLRMPSTIHQIWEWFRCRDAMFRRNKTFAVIEEVKAIPKFMGVVSSFTFGKHYGTLLACLTISGIPFEEVKPQRWQSALHVPPKRKKEKQDKWKLRLAEHAQRLFPVLPIWQEKKDAKLAVADALLIAEFCRRIHTASADLKGYAQ